MNLQSIVLVSLGSEKFNPEMVFKSLEDQDPERSAGEAVLRTDKT